MADVDRIPIPGATNDQIAKGVNDLHTCVEILRSDVEEIKALPGKTIKWVLVTGAGVLLSQAITFGQNYLNHQEVTRKQDTTIAVAADVANTSRDSNRKLTNALGD